MTLRLTLAALAVAASLVDAATARVHSGVYSTLQTAGKANIVVQMAAKTEELLRTIETTRFATRGQKIEAVFSKLDSHATESQKSIDSLLANESASGQPLYDAQHRSWAMNARLINGATLELVEALAALPVVALIREQVVARIHTPEVQAIAAFDPETQAETPFDTNAHVTHVTGTIAGAKGYGVAPGAKWMVCRGCSDTCAEINLVKCGEFMMCPTDTKGENKDCSKAPHVINNSWATSGGQDFYREMVDAWQAAGIVPVFDVGNGGPNCATAGSPGDYANVISGGAMTATETLAHFSSRGPALNGMIKPDISAPGASIASAWNTSDSSFVSISRTSLSTPHVTRAVALLLSSEPNLNYHEVYQRLTSTTDKAPFNSTLSTGHGGRDTCGRVKETEFPNNHFGHGRLNVFSAYQGLRQTPTPTPGVPTPAPTGVTPGPTTEAPSATTATPAPSTVDPTLPTVSPMPTNDTTAPSTPLPEPTTPTPVPTPTTPVPEVTTSPNTPVPEQTTAAPEATTITPAPEPTTTTPAPATTTPTPSTEPPESTTRRPAPSSMTFCNEWGDKTSCQFWFWCNWEHDSETCSDRF